ncbi:hypothetical protein G9A89_003320 [Geosiphon pyriformis]|nr:hypothetical protein G9A89_003320 [Geosiphon pyriformis]
MGSTSTDWAALEAGPKWESVHGTKLMKECGQNLERYLHQSGRQSVCGRKQLQQIFGRTGRGDICQAFNHADYENIEGIENNKKSSNNITRWKNKKNPKRSNVVTIADVHPSPKKRENIGPEQEE